MGKKVIQSLDNDLKGYGNIKGEYDDLSSQLVDMTTLITPSMSQTTIQNAINNSATKKIKFMSGSYNLSSLTLSNVSVEGEGSDNTTLTTSFSIGSNVTFSNIKLSSTNSVPILQNNTSNVWFNRCYITGNGIYLNDLSANNIHFKDCELAFCTGTAINIVDKCTLAKHIQDIYVENCYFHDNTNGNIGCISRQDGTNPVVSGYQNINLLNCRFIKEVNVQSDMEINVSFDSFVSSPKNLSGNITVRGCTFINGFYGFECAGGTDLIFEHNTIIQNSTVGARILSMSNLSSTYSNAIIRNNTFNGVGGVYVVGNNNIFEHNNINTSGVGLVIGTGDSVTCRHNDVVVTNGNSIIVSIATNMLVENNYLNNSATSGNNAIVISNCNGSIVSIVNNIINTLAVPIQITGSTSEIVQSGNKNAKGYDMPSYYQGNTNNGSIKKVQKYSSSNFFTVTNNNATIQSNMLMKVTYSSRNNNNPVGGFFTVAFNTFSSANVLPFVTNGTNITVTVGSTSPYVFTFTLTSVVNDSVLFDIEMVTLKTGDWVIN